MLMPVSLDPTKTPRLTHLMRQDAAPRAGFGEERADLNKADHSVKKKLPEKENCSGSFKIED
jgi:hypothetical protein